MPEYFLKYESSKPFLLKITTWVIRIIVGGLFIVSGFTKGIDPWGTIFKFNEYIGAWGYEVWDSLVLVGVFILCIAEFITGFCILTGCFRRTSSIAAILIMAFMLPLTLWLAIKNPISDCGCFGDAIKLSNWETFYKNIILTLGTLWLLFFNKKVSCLINPYLQWIGLLAAGIYLFAIAWIGYYYQPLIDFRDYKIGTRIVDDEEDISEDEDDFLRFKYRKNGIEKIFSITDELPDESEGWEFVERFYEFPDNGEGFAPKVSMTPANEKGLRFFSENGREDLTDEVIGNGRQLLLMIPNLTEVSAAKTWKINSFFEWCNKNDIEMLATVGGNPYEIDQWKNISLAEYPIYTSDDTAIEEVVRGNPGIVYLEDGIIKWKSSLKSINIDDFQKETYSNDPMSFARNNNRILWNLTWIFLAIELLLILFSFFPTLLSKLIKRGKRNEQTNAC